MLAIRSQKKKEILSLCYPLNQSCSHGNTLEPIHLSKWFIWLVLCDFCPWTFDPTTLAVAGQGIMVEGPWSGKDDDLGVVS